jgi:hypothetical protein
MYRAERLERVIPMPNPEQTIELKKPHQSEKDARADPHRPEHYVPSGIFTLASFIRRMTKQA